MDLKGFFNILLLSLSLATVLITLISYLLYKLRQLQVKGHFKDPFRMDGLYFVRYAPHLEKKNIEARLNANVKEKKSGFNVSLGALFLITVGVIAVSLFAETYFVELQERRGKIAIADNYRKLVEKGYLKRFDYTPNPSTEKFEALASDVSELRQNELDQSFNKFKFYIGSTKNKSDTFDKSQAKWERFFESKNAIFKKGNLLDIKQEYILILPAAISLNRTEKDKIEEFLKQGGSVVATGPFAILNGLREKDPEWVHDLLSIKFRNCEENTQFPVLFSVDEPPFWNLMSGSVVTWPVQDNRYCVSANSAFLENKKLILAVETNYDGVIRYSDQLKNIPNIRMIKKEILNGRLIWMAHDPEMGLALDSKFAMTHNEVLQGAVSWVAKSPSAKVAAWPEGKDVAVAFGAQVQKDSDYFQRFLRKVVELKIPLTLFLNSNSVTYLRETLREEKFEKVELAVVVDTQLVSQASKFASISRVDFDSIERSRLDIEEQAAQIVHGIRIPKRSFSSSNMFSSLINQLKFLVVDEYQSGLQLLSFEKRPFLWIPRYSPFNEDLGLTRIPASFVRTTEETKKSIEMDAAFKRLITVQIDDVGLESIELLDKVTQFMSRHSWQAFSFEKLYHWIYGRSQINVSISSKNPQLINLRSPSSKGKSHSTNNERDDLSYYLKVSNESGLTMENVTLLLDVPGGNQILLSAALEQSKDLELAAQNKSIEKVKLNSKNTFTIAKLGPREHLRYLVETSMPATEAKSKESSTESKNEKK